MKPILPLLALAAAAGLVACGPVSGPVDVEALVLDEDNAGRFRLDTVTLDTVTDVHRGFGERFDVRGGFTVSSQTLVDELGAQQLDLDDMVERARSGLGHDVAPRLAWDGRRYVAEDFDSLQYLTLFEGFEEAWRYFDDVIGDSSAATRDKSVVGYYGAVSLLEILPLPLLTSDNAAFVAFADGWLTFRVVAVNEGVPFAMNPGVVAHEFQHRVFFHQVFGGEGFDTWRAWVTTEDRLSRAGALVKGLDEGLADLFAAGHVRSPAFMEPSLAGGYATHAAFRHLEGGFADAATYDLLATSDVGAGSDLGSDVDRHCGEWRAADATDPDAPAEDLYAKAGFNFYCVGTIVARALYDGAGGDFDVLRERLLPAVNRALPAVGREIHRESAQAGALVFDMDVFLEAVAAGLDDLALRAETCAAFGQRFESLMTPERVPSCF